MSKELSNDNDNNSIKSSPNEKIREPNVENDNVAPDRTTVQVEGDGNDHNKDSNSQVASHNYANASPDKKTTGDDDNASPASNTSPSPNASQSTGEPSTDNEDTMTVQDNVAPTGNIKIQQENVNDSNESGDDLPLSPGRTNSGQTPQKTSEQLVKEENNPAAKAVSPRNSQKTKSHAHQLRTNTGTRIRHHSPHLQHRHSLDENNFVNSDSDEHDDYSYSSFEYYTTPDGQSLPKMMNLAYPSTHNRT